MDKANIQDIYPLSPLQEGILFHTVMAPEEGDYLRQAVRQLDGRLDVDALRRAWQAVLDHHSILRTAFVWEGVEKPVQVVCRRVEMPWRELDWRALSRAEQEAELEVLLVEDRRRGFVLTEAPLMRVTVIRTTPAAHLLVWSFHHLLMDGWSVSLVLQRLLLSYMALSQGQPLPPLASRPYRDYIAWLRGRDLAGAETFWRRELAGFTAPTQLPLAAPSSASAAHASAADEARAGGVLLDHRRILPGLGERLDAFARRHQLTVNTLVQGAWALLLARHSGQGDVVFGNTTSGRPTSLPGFEQMVGLFINTLAVRVRVEAGEKLVPWLRRLQAAQAAAREHEHTPLVRVQGWSEVPRGEALFESIVVFENYRVEELEATPEELPLSVGDSRFVDGSSFPLSLIVSPGPPLELRLSYAPRRFEGGRGNAVGRRILGHLATLLAGFAEHPEGVLAGLPLLTAGERQQLLVEWNDRPLDETPARFIHQPFAGWAARTPNAPAVISASSNDGDGGGEEILTYAELAVWAAHLARRLRRLGVGPETRVAVCGRRSPAMVAGLVAVLQAGGAYVPIDPAYPEERLAFLLEDADPPVLLVEPAVLELLPEHAARIVPLEPPSDEELANELADDELGAPPAVPGLTPDHPAYVIYTSGSTGRPKGVVVSHRAVVHSTRSRLTAYRKPVEAYLLASPFAFDSSVAGIFWTLWQGGALVLPPDDFQQDLPGLVRLLGRHRLSHLLCLPSLHGLLLSTPGSAQLEDLSVVIVAGEACPASLVARHRAALPGTALYNEYGPTECAVWSTLYDCLLLPAGEAGPVPIGRPIPGYRVHLVGPAGAPVAAGVAAELLVGGSGRGRSGLARGYLGRPGLTAERFVPDLTGLEAGGRLYRTGDLVRWLPDGNLEFLGRIDHQVKVRGYRIELGEIEAVLGGCPGVREAVVVAREDETHGQGDSGPEAARRLVAYLVFDEVAGEPGAAPDLGALRAYLGERLPAYMVPAVYVSLPELPHTPNGKVDRKRLPAPEDHRLELGGERRLPSTPAEIALAEIWRAVLRLEAVGVDDNFFALGGDSILALQVVSRAHRAELRINPRQLFAHPTIAGLAGAAREADAGSAGQVSAEQGPVTGPVPLTPVQHWFFDQALPEAHHYNQALLLASDEPLDPARLGRAVAQLLAHHDALRMRFVLRDGEIRQENAGLGPDVDPEHGTGAFRSLDLSHLDEPGPTIERVAARVQASFDLARGPLFAAVHFACGGRGEPDRLLLAAHHLVVDGVSWRILLDDLAALLEEEPAAALPPKTTSFAAWARLLAEHASSDMAAEAESWIALAARARRVRRAELGARLAPAAAPATGGARTAGLRVTGARADAHSVDVSLDTESTRALLGAVPAALRAGIDEVLLAALARTLALPGEALLVELEGHGREPEALGGAAAAVDLSRTVGWLTSIYPVLLEVPRGGGVGETLAVVKEALRAVPSRGVGYGLLRYGPCRDEGQEDLRRRLAEMPRPDVGFNYLGQVDAALAARAVDEGGGAARGGHGFHPAPESPGPTSGPGGDRAHLLDVNALVRGGELRVSWTASSRLFSAEALRELGERFSAELRHLVGAVRDSRTSVSRAALAPSDFPLADLTAETLATVLATPDAQEETSPAGSAGAGSVRVEDIHPLSPLQEGMLFHSLYGPESGEYVEQVSVRLEGELDVELFLAAWRRAIERHAILRASFHWRDLPRPLARVEAGVELPVTLEDWRSEDEGPRDTRLADFLAADARRGFELTRAPLLRLALLRLEEGVWRLVWSFHHLLLDGAGTARLAAEIFEIYAASLPGGQSSGGQREPRLLPARPYGEHIAWLAAQDRAAADDWWRRSLAGFTSPTPLPVDRPAINPETVAASGERQPRTEILRLAPAAAEALTRFARGAHLTLNTLVSGAWGLLLARHAGGDEAVFGVTLTAQAPEHGDGVAMLGLFINTLPARIRLTAEGRSGQPVGDWLRRLQENLTELRQHASVALPQVQALSEVVADRPLFESILVFENWAIDTSMRPAEGEMGLRVEGVEVTERTHYPLLAVAVPREGMTLKLTYQPERFHPTTIRRLLRAWAGLLTAMAAAPDAPLADLPLLAPEEGHQLLVEWPQQVPGTSTAAEVSGTLDRAFASRVAAAPDAIALVIEDEALSYGELARRAGSLARRLRRLGCGPESRVALLFERSTEMVVGILGTLAAGAAYVPLDPSAPADRLATIVSDALVGASPILVSTGGLFASRLAEALPAELRDALTVVEVGERGEDEGEADSRLMPVPGLLPDHPAYVIYTSGSTGQPKGVVNTHRNVLRLFSATDAWYGFGAEDVWPLFHSYAFDVSVWELWGALLHGGRLHVVPYWVSRDPDRFFDLLREARATVLNQTPSAFRGLMQARAFTRVQVEAQAGTGDLAVRRVIFAGEPLPLSLLEPWWRRYGSEQARLINMYGITETTVHVTYRELRPADLVPQLGTPIGVPMPDLAMLVLDSRGRPLPLGAPGEAAVRGPGLARGYHRRPGLTAQRFVPDAFSGRPGERLYRSGDLVRHLPDGELEHLGRIDFQVKIRGFRIELGEIESVLASHLAVREGVVVAHEAGLGGHSETGAGEAELVAYVVAAAGEETSEAALRDHLAARLPAYMVPSFIVQLDAIPLTVNGKLDRRALPAPRRAGGPGEGLATPPRTLTESLVAGIWEEVLGVEGVGAGSNFFALGGHSLLATQVVSRLRRVCDVELPLRRLFDAPVLADLARAVDEARRGEERSVPPLLPLGAESDGSPQVVAPLSFAQQRLWFLDRLEPGSSAYNIPLLGRLRGPLDPAVLDRALAEVVRRHEVLRTHFPAVAGEPVQRVVASLPPPLLHRVDLSALEESGDETGHGAAGPEAIASRLLAGAADQPFDLARGPVFRGLLLRLGAEDHIAGVTLHHIVSDAWSIGLMSRELGTLYRAFAAGEPSPLPPLPVQYQDFAAWQRGWLSGEVLAAEIEHWRARLIGAPPFLPLPTDRPRPAVQTYRGAAHPVRLGPGPSHELAALCRREGVTPFMALLASFALFLSRRTQRDDLVVGTPIAGRHHLETERLLGLFVNTLALRLQIGREPGAAEPTFRDLLALARTVALDAQEHQDLPFERLVEELRLERSLSYPPVFQVLFAWQNAPRRDLELGAARLEPISAGEERAQLDLTLNLRPQGAESARPEIAGALLYNVDLFDSTTAARMVREIETLLGGALADPGRPHHLLPSLASAERHQLTVEWPGAWAPGEPVSSAASLPLHLAFLRQAEAHPDAIAVGMDDEQLSYGELARRAGRLGGRLRQAGIGPESRVGLFLERSPELVVAILGVLCAGGAYVPLDPSAPESRLDFMLADALAGSSARVVITSPSVETTWIRDREGESGDLTLLWVDSASREPGPDVAPAAGVFPDHPAYVIYTSGSTGQPKGVVVSHHNVQRLFAATDAWFGFGDRDVWTLFHSYAFDFSVWEMWGALLHGGRLVIVPYWTSRAPDRFAELLRRQRVTVLNQTPSAFRQLSEAVAREGSLPEALRWVIFGGEALTPASIAAWPAGRSAAGAPGPDLVNMYGITETTVHVTGRWITRREMEGASAGQRELVEGEAARSVGSSSTLPIGIPMPDLRLHVLDPRGEPVALGVPGEARIGGGGLARGYLGRPALTASRFGPDPFSEQPGERLYASGDLVRWRPAGELGAELEHLGRIDHQVQLRGFRVELGEIEAALTAHPAVHVCAVLLSGSVAGGDEPRLTAYWVPAAGLVTDGSTQLAALRAHLRLSLPEYMMPAAFERLEMLPLTVNGKLDRRALLALAPAPADGSAEAPSPRHLPPGTGLEADLAVIWRQVLGVDRVGLHDNFFDLGGHSLLVVRVQHQLREELGREVPIIDLFRYPTLSALAAHLKGGTEAPGESARLEPAAARALQAPGRVLAPNPGPDTDEGIAIVGMAGRFPGAPDVESLWRMLAAGKEGIRFFTDAELLAAGVERALLDDPAYVPAHGALEGVESFDAAFFGMSPREAQITDPQHRLFLETAWHALEAAGIDPRRFPGAIGSFAGVGFNSYWGHLMDHPEVEAAVGSYALILANDKDYLPTRLAYKLDLTGPAVSVQTACSTSLVAVHLARRALLAGDCDLALAGGVSVRAEQVGGYRHSEGGITSPDGHCRAFDAAARGTVPGSGVGLVVLRRLADAEAAGDHIHAVIRGSAINNDGARKIGFTAPSIEGQARVIRQALASAGVEPASIGYIETHGTGTVLGDPIEIAALTEAYGRLEDMPASDPPGENGARHALGSVKASVGHLDTAAGVTGLIKAALAVEHGQVPPSPYFEAPNPEIDLAAGGFHLPRSLQPWPRLGEAGDGPRRAAVSAFGIGGTNAHLILEQAPDSTLTSAEEATSLEATSLGRRWQLLPLSARTPSALARLAARLADHLEAHRELSLADVAHTLREGRTAFEHRRVVVAESAAAAVAALRAPEPVRAAGGRVGQAASETPPPVAFLFPGQGTQYPGMGEALYAGEPVFRRQVDLGSDFLRHLLGQDLRRVLYPGSDGERDAAAVALAGTALAQPALFITQVALARLWESWGVRPAALLGHSVGELAAAHLAGVLDLEDALALVAARGRLMQETPPGAMLALPLSEQEVGVHLGDEISLAAVNGPHRVVVSGSLDAVEALAAELAAAGVEGRRLAADRAFHSPLMEPILPRFAAEVAKVKLSPPERPWLSNLTGTWVTPEQATDADYWVRQLRSPVRFADSLGRLLEEVGGVLLEVGPGRTLTTLARRHAAWGESHAAVASLPRKAAEPELPCVLSALGALWRGGAEVDWGVFAAEEPRRRVHLPLYPFERQRYWLDRVPAGRRQAARSPGKRADISDWFYQPSWELTPPPPEPELSPRLAQEGRWLLFLDPLGVGEAVARRLESAGIEVVRVEILQAGSGTAENGSASEPLRELAPGRYALAPDRREGYEALLEALRPRSDADGEGSDRLARILHFWGVSDPSADAPETRSQAWDPLTLGCGSLLFLGQALVHKLFVDPLRIFAVTARAQAVLAGELPSPEKAAALGPLRVLGQEYPHLDCRAVDIDPPAAEEIDATVDLLLAELTGNATSSLVAHRAGRRLRRAFRPLPLAAGDARRSPYRPGGLYLLIGGLGRLGLSLAEELARARARLVLVGRSVPPAREAWDEHLRDHPADDPTSQLIGRLRGIEAAGGELLVARADAADAGALREVFALARERFGGAANGDASWSGFDGLFHLAGAAGRHNFRALEDTTPETLVRHFRAKVEGVRALDSALAELPAGEQPELRVLFSSLASVLGGLGFAAYSAANLYLDAFAEGRNAVAAGEAGAAGFGPWLSINWDGWRSSPPKGAKGEETPAEGLGSSVADLAMTHEEGLEALRRLLLARARGQIAVSTGDLEARIERWLRPRPAAAPTPMAFSRPELSTDFAAPTTEAERRVAEIWGTLLGIEGIGLHDNFYELGGDSLLATQVISRLRTVFRAELPMSSLFETPTVAGLAAALGAGLAEQAESDRLDAILRRIEGMSPEEVEARMDGDGAVREVSS